MNSAAWDKRIGPQAPLSERAPEVMTDGDGWGCSYLVVRGEILGFAKDEPVRKHSSGTFPSIKNVRLGIEDDQIPS